MNHRRLFALACACALVTTALRADVAEMIGKARAFLGGDAALDAVHSIHFVGTTIESDAKGDSEPFPIDIVFQKDFQQRITVKKPVQTEIIALDDYDAWHRVQDTNAPDRGQTMLYVGEKVKQLRATSWENLAFFKGLEQIGGSVVDDGLVELDGKKVHKMTFIHEPGLVYIRYFDADSGQLILSETDQGSRIREDGEIRADGVRFPQRIVITNTEASGEQRKVTINISKVTVNEKFPEDYFSVPLVIPK
ncbi:MAG TPA: hypothetical protein VIM69_09370 [Opitutaceae bacterium]